jgi:SAM-dependent methyltransferase
MPRNDLIKRVAEWFFGAEAALARAWSSSAHRRLLMAQWGLQPTPEHFDHHIDLSHQWLKTRNPLWLERGVFSALALKGGNVLELACGDGFNTRNFYSLKSRRVVGCDIDPAAIATARRKNSAPNVEYVVADMRHAMPRGSFDNVVWDFAYPLVRYFSADEIDAILVDIKSRLSSDGVLSGYTMAAAADPAQARGAFDFLETKHLHDFLAPHFAHVTVFETRSPDRHNFYFWASDGAIPFHPSWPHAHLTRPEADASPTRQDGFVA